MPRILIIGGAGFIGSHLARMSLELGDEVHIAVKPETDIWRLQAFCDQIKVHRLSLLNGPDLDRCFHDAAPDQIYHLASRVRWSPVLSADDARISLDSELKALMNIVISAGRIPSLPRIVRASSLAEYGDGATPFVETQREMPLNVYAASLVAGTHYLQMLQKKLLVNVVTARLGLTYGENQSEDFLVPKLIKSCLAGEPIRIERPDDRRDLIQVDEVVEALRLMATQDLPTGLVMNISTSIAPTVREIAETVIQLTAQSRGLVEFGDGSAAPTGTKLFIGANDLAYRLLGWKPVVPYEEGISRLIKAIQNSSAVSREMK
jgi:nucleoside-diphosphate-sugar epimerase